MKISVVISIKNRTKLFKRSLKLYNKQTMPKCDWELVIVDDMSEDDILQTLKDYAANINWQYIKMDSHKNDFPIYWGPSLSNNIGFKAAKGDVIVITGPEMLMKETALELSYEDAIKGYTTYGHIRHSHNMFVSLMDQNSEMENYEFDKLFILPTAKNGYPDITKDNFYWFWAATKRDNLIQINGCDENFMRGICGDDDSFVDRLRKFGSEPIHNYNIQGIHQEHALADKSDPKRIRWNSTWEIARKINTDYLEKQLQNSNPIANIGRDWGSDSLILFKWENNII